MRRDRYNGDKMKVQQAGTVADLSGLYDEDFFEWTRRNAELLRSGQLDQADIGHIGEEIEDMGKRDLRELNSRMQVLLIRLLKRQLQPEKRSRPRDSTSVSQRIEIEGVLDQTGPARDRFPGECPYTLEQILDPEFLS